MVWGGCSSRDLVVSTAIPVQGDRAVVIQLNCLKAFSWCPYLRCLLRNGFGLEPVVSKKNSLECVC